MRGFKVFFMFKDKGHNKIYYDRTPKRKERKVNKIHAHGGRPNAQFFPPPGTYAKSLLFEPIYNTQYHSLKYSSFSQNGQANATTETFFDPTIVIVQVYEPLTL
jgi:hypothetical protein